MTREEKISAIVAWDLSEEGWCPGERREWLSGVLINGWEGYATQTDAEIEARYGEVVSARGTWEG
jgi:hypothetical protein